MKKKTNNYLEQLKREQQAATTPQQKPVSEMTEAELDRAIEEAKAELRQVKERELQVHQEARQEARQGGSSRSMFVGKSRKKRPWK